MLDVPSTQDPALQARYNRQIDEALESLKDELTKADTALQYVKDIPSTYTTVAEITAYLRSMPW